MKKPKKPKRETRLEQIKRHIGRVPLPQQTGGPHSSKKGKRGYRRQRDRKRVTHDEATTGSGTPRYFITFRKS